MSIKGQLILKIELAHMRDGLRRCISDLFHSFIDQHLYYILLRKNLIRITVAIAQT